MASRVSARRVAEIGFAIAFVVFVYFAWRASRRTADTPPPTTTRAPRPPEHADPGDRLRIGLPPSCGSALLTLARSRGIAADAGVPFELRQFPSGRRTLKELFAGHVDLAVVGDLPIAAAALDKVEKKDFVILGRIARSKFDRWVITRPGIDKASDLRGKRIAATRGTGSEFILDRFLAEANLTAKDVEVVDMRDEEITRALLGGRVDAVAVAAPYYGTGKDHFRTEVQELSLPGLHSLTFLLVARRSVVTKSRDKVESLLRQLVEAEKAWTAKTAIEPIADEIADALMTSRARLRAECAAMQVALDLDTTLVEQLDRANRWFAQHGKRRGRAPRPASSYIEVGPLRAVDTSLHTSHVRGL